MYDSNDSKRYFGKAESSSCSSSSEVSSFFQVQNKLHEGRDQLFSIIAVWQVGSSLDLQIFTSMSNFTIFKKSEIEIRGRRGSEAVVH